MRQACQQYDDSEEEEGRQQGQDNQRTSGRMTVWLSGKSRLQEACSACKPPAPPQPTHSPGSGGSKATVPRCRQPSGSVQTTAWARSGSGCGGGGRAAGRQRACRASGASSGGKGAGDSAIETDPQARAVGSRQSPPNSGRGQAGRELEQRNRWRGALAEGGINTPCVQTAQPALAPRPSLPLGRALPAPQRPPPPPPRPAAAAQRWQRR
jgi:hypothetical protein